MVETPVAWCIYGVKNYDILILRTDRLIVTVCAYISTIVSLFYWGALIVGRDIIMLTFYKM